MQAKHLALKMVSLKHCDFTMRSGTPSHTLSNAALISALGVSPRMEPLIQFFQTFIPQMALIIAMIEALQHGVSTPAIVACVALYAITGLGITLGWHRLFTHRSYTTTQS